jgi:hypothetical protein
MTVHAFDQGHLLATIRANPRRPGEGALVYVQRLAVLAGLVEPEATAGTPPDGWSSAGEVLAEEPAERWDQR